MCDSRNRIEIMQPVIPLSSAFTTTDLGHSDMEMDSDEERPSGRAMPVQTISTDINTEVYSLFPTAEHA
jgi:hypothetical protein